MDNRQFTFIMFHLEAKVCCLLFEYEANATGLLVLLTAYSSADMGQLFLFQVVIVRKVIIKIALQI